MRSWTKRRKLTVLGALTALILAGVAWAVWTVGGSGNTTARAGQLQPLTFEAVAFPAAGVRLFPGQSAPVYAEVQSANSGPMEIISLASGGPIVSSDPGNCPANNVTVNAGTLATPVTVPVGITPGFSIPNAVSLDVEAPSPCQGVTFTVPISVTARPDTTP
jgi:hypothetical protein